MITLSGTQIVTVIFADLIFFGIGITLSYIAGWRASQKAIRDGRYIDNIAFLRIFITVVVSFAWIGSIVVELVDRSFQTNFLLHLIMGTIVGTVSNVKFSTVLKNFNNVTNSGSTDENIRQNG